MRALLVGILFLGCGGPTIAVRAGPDSRGTLDAAFTVTDGRGCSGLKALWLSVNDDLVPDPVVGTGCKEVSWASAGSAKTSSDGLMHAALHDGTAQLQVVFTEPRGGSLPALIGGATIQRGTDRTLNFPASFTAPCEGADDRTLRLTAGLETMYVECAPQASCTAANTMNVTLDQGTLRFTLPTTFPVASSVINVTISCHPLVQTCGFGGGCDVSFQNSARIYFNVQ